MEQGIIFRILTLVQTGHHHCKASAMTGSIFSLLTPEGGYMPFVLHEYDSNCLDDNIFAFSKIS